MQKTTNFLNNQRCIGSERTIKKVLAFLQYLKHNEKGYMFFSLVFFIVGIIQLIIIYFDIGEVKIEILWVGLAAAICIFFIYMFKKVFLYFRYNFVFAINIKKYKIFITPKVYKLNRFRNKSAIMKNSYYEIIKK